MSHLYVKSFKEAGCCGMFKAQWGCKPASSASSHVFCSKGTYEGLRHPIEGQQVSAKSLPGDLNCVT